MDPGHKARDDTHLAGRSLDAEDGAGDRAGAGANGAAVVAGTHNPLPVGGPADDFADVVAPHHHGAHLRRGRAAVMPPVPGHVEVRSAATLGAHPPAAPGSRTRPDAAMTHAARAQVAAAFEVPEPRSARATRRLRVRSDRVLRRSSDQSELASRCLRELVRLPDRSEFGIIPLNVAARVEGRTRFSRRNPGRQRTGCRHRKYSYSHSDRPRFIG